MSEFDVIVDPLGARTPVSNDRTDTRRLSRTNACRSACAGGRAVRESRTRAGSELRRDTCRRAKWQRPLFAEIRERASNLVSRHSNPE
ncbi:hypothetical protein FOM02_28680 [Bradyrhizobium sp. SEMIA]|nr:hypothetical protein FOM02_28680 [Bradyrhizobium sp. SEMIA]